MEPINSRTGGYRLGGYSELAVCGGAQPFAEVAWTYSFSGADVNHQPPMHRVIPETGVSLCAYLRRTAEHRVADVELILMGPIRRVRFFIPDPAVHIAALRLKSEWCHDILGIDPAEHADALDPVPPQLARRLSKLYVGLGRLREPLGAIQLLTEAAHWLAQERATSSSSCLARAALDGARAHPDAQLSVRERASTLGVSERHLRRALRETAGIGVKYFQRIRRLHLAVSLAEQSGPANWARIAAASGYYDQAHLNSEFRALTGTTPMRLRAERAAQ